MLRTRTMSSFANLQVGYNSDGTIVAADITYYSNAGCTLDESMFVRKHKNVFAYVKDWLKKSKQNTRSEAKISDSPPGGWLQ